MSGFRDKSINGSGLRLRNIAGRVASLPRALVLSVTLITVIGLLYSLSSVPGNAKILDTLHAGGDHSYHSSNKASKLGEAFQTLYDAIRHPVPSPSYTDAYGNVFEISKEGPWWTKPLKKQILIVDIDTRVPDGSNELWNQSRMNWETLNNDGDGGMISASQMNHFLYGTLPPLVKTGKPLLTQ